MRHLSGLTILLLLSCHVASADGPSDNIPANVRQIPPPGVEVSAEDRAALGQQLELLAGRLTSLGQSKDARAQSLLPDVEIFYRAVRDALAHDEFFSPGEVKSAFDLLRTGIERAV